MSEKITIRNQHHCLIMIERVLTLGLIGIVLINDVAGVIDQENGGFKVIKRPNDDKPNDMGTKDYVNENLDDLDPKPKIVDPASEYDPSLNAIYFTNKDNQTTESYPIIGNRFGIDSEKQNIATEKPKPTEKVEANTEAQPAFNCPFPLCIKINEALKNARKELDKNYESLMDAGKSMFEAKVKFLQSLPTAGITFFRSLMNRDEKS